MKLDEPKMNFSGEVVRGDNESQTFVDKIFEISEKYDLRTPQYDLTTEVLAQQKLIINLDKTIINHPAHKFGDSKKLKRYRKRIIEIEQEIVMKNNLLEETKTNQPAHKFGDSKKLKRYRKSII